MSIKLFLSNSERKANIIVFVKLFLCISDRSPNIFVQIKMLKMFFSTDEKKYNCVDHHASVRVFVYQVPKLKKFGAVAGG